MKKFLLVFVLLSVAIPLRSWEIKREIAVTKDGVKLVAKRYSNPGAIPIILLHGFASNYNTWDVPGKSLGKYLAERGYDVWLFNLRGHGEWEYQSGPSKGPGNWDFDTFAVYDIPAIVQKVISATGKKPFWIGHSMGGMLIYAYLEGVTDQTTKYGFTVTSSEKLSLKRNYLLRGVITVGSPAGLSYPVKLKGKGLKALVKNNYSDYNLLLEMLADSPWKKFKPIFLYPVTHNETISDFLDLNPAILSNSTFTVVLDFVGPLFLNFLGEHKHPDLGYFHKFVEENLHLTSMQFVLGYIWNVRNTDRKDIYFMAKHGLDNISPRLLQQFHMWLRYGNFKELCDGTPCNHYDYSANLYRVKLPILLIAGGLDKLVNKDNIKERVYLKIGSSDKTYRVFAGFGHVDLCMGKRVGVIFKYMEEWLKIHERAGIQE